MEKPSQVGALYHRDYHHLSLTHFWLKFQSKKTRCTQFKHNWVYCSPTTIKISFLFFSFLFTSWLQALQDKCINVAHTHTKYFRLLSTNVEIIFTLKKNWSTQKKMKTKSSFSFYFNHIIPSQQILILETIHSIFDCCLTIFKLMNNNIIFNNQSNFTESFIRPKLAISFGRSTCWKPKLFPTTGSVKIR